MQTIRGVFRMSHEKVKSIKIDEKEGKVYFNTASNNVIPITYSIFSESTFYNNLLKEKGRKAVEIEILKEYESGNLQGGINKYTKALKVLRYIFGGEYKKFNWRNHNAKYGSPEREEEENKNSKEMEKFKEKIEKEKEPSFEKIGEFKRILEFIKISKKENKINPVVYFFDYPRNEKGEVIRTENGNYPDKEKQYLKPLRILKNDEFAKIQTFIYENDKPKNKYTLCIIGKTIFNKKLIEKIPYYYGLGVHDEDTNIRAWLRDAPTKEELIKWIDKKKDVLKDFLEEHKAVEKEYKEVIESTKTKDWQKAYWESRKDYYENFYSHGTETDEYKHVLGELKKLK